MTVPTAPICAPASRLGKILLRKKLLTPDQLAHFLNFQQSGTRQPLGEMLVNAGLISPEQLNEALQEQHWRRQGYWVID
ncbi:MAG: hypothetical protein AAGG02_04735 [Cyanobacteria bacterium P01_H01_bin.15]